MWFAEGSASQPFNKLIYERKQPDPEHKDQYVVKPLAIGRHRVGDIIYSDDYLVSREHAHIHIEFVDASNVQRPKIFITDLSKSGTWVNDVRIANKKRHELHENDRVCVGNAASSFTIRWRPFLTLFSRIGGADKKAMKILIHKMGGQTAKHNTWSSEVTHLFIPNNNLPLTAKVISAVIADKAIVTMDWLNYVWESGEFPGADTNSFMPKNLQTWLQIGLENARTYGTTRGDLFGGKMFIFVTRQLLHNHKEIIENCKGDTMLVAGTASALKHAIAHDISSRSDIDAFAIFDDDDNKDKRIDGEYAYYSTRSIANAILACDVNGSENEIAWKPNHRPAHQNDVKDVKLKLKRCDVVIDNHNHTHQHSEGRKENEPPSAHVRALPRKRKREQMNTNVNVHAKSESQSHATHASHAPSSPKRVEPRKQQQDSQQLFLAQQAQRYPQLAAHYEKLEELYSKKLYHQLTKALIQFIFNDESFVNTDNMIMLYLNFIAKIQRSLNSIELSRLIVRISKQFDSLENALKFLDTICMQGKDNNSQNNKNDSGGSTALSGVTTASMFARGSVSWMILQCEIGSLYLAGNLVPQCKQIMDEITDMLERSQQQCEHSALYSMYYRVCLQYYKTMGVAQQYLDHSLKFLTHTKAQDLPKPEQLLFGSDICLAALLSEQCYNFSILLSHGLIQLLQRTEFDWLYQIICIFNTGDLNAWRTFCLRHEESLKAHETIRSQLAFLEQKIRLMALVELVFQTPAHERCISFETISTQCKLQMDEVEFVLIRAMSLQLIRGIIDEVDKTVTISYCVPRFLQNAQIADLRQNITRWIEKINQTKQDISVQLKTNKLEVGAI